MITRLSRNSNRLTSRLVIYLVLQGLTVTAMASLNALGSGADRVGHCLVIGGHYPLQLVSVFQLCFFFEIRRYLCRHETASKEQVE